MTNPDHDLKYLRPELAKILYTRRKIVRNCVPLHTVIAATVHRKKM